MVEHVNFADAVMPSTEFLAHMLVHHGVSPSKVRVIPYGVDVGRLPHAIPVPASFEDSQPLRLGYIGTFSEKKAPHVILDALALLPRRMGRVTLSLYGKVEEGDRYAEMLRNKAEALGGAVRLGGTFPHEQIGEVLRGLHLLVVPSVWYESAPLVLCSALNAHVPLLVSDLGGLTEMLDHQRFGFSYPPGDAPGLSNLIDAILNDPRVLTDLRKNMEGLHRTTQDYADEVEREYLRFPGP
jgi:glycosyltransferase involved in cell wall biosynthesis